MSQNIKFELKTAGYCLASKHHALKGAAREEIRFYATYGLLKHPKEGYILFDTGYTNRFFDLTKSYPEKLYSMMTPVFIKPEEEAKAVLAKQGIRAEEINYIIISHFHTDHVGGLKDFPNAQFICSRNAFEDFWPRQGFSAVKKGYLRNLVPDDFEERLLVVDFEKCSKENEFLGPLIDLFSDDSILLCSLEGHARGQIGALFQTDQNQVFLAADAAWLEESYKQYWLPHPIVRLFFDDWKKFKKSLKKVHDFHLANKEAIIIPTHCNTSRLRYGSEA